jgi:hypothetical protein
MPMIIGVLSVSVLVGSVTRQVLPLEPLAHVTDTA